MPAPKLLAALPKPILFGLYGAAGGLLGALVFGELLWYLLRPPVATAAAPEPRVAVAVARDVEVFVEARRPCSRPSGRPPSPSRPTEPRAKLR